MFIVYKGAVVSDSLGTPREFARRRSAHSFIRDHRLRGAVLRNDISELPRRYRTTSEDWPLIWGIR